MVVYGIEVIGKFVIIIVFLVSFDGDLFKYVIVNLIECIIVCYLYEIVVGKVVVVVEWEVVVLRCELVL